MRARTPHYISGQLKNINTAYTFDDEVPKNNSRMKEEPNTDTDQRMILG